MKMLIGGVPKDSKSKMTTEVVNPATGDFIDTIPNATQEDVEKLCEHCFKRQRTLALDPSARKVEAVIPVRRRTA